MSITTSIAQRVQSQWVNETSATFERWGQDVNGWFKSTAELDMRPGIFIVATPIMGHPCILAVEESTDVHTRVSDHENARIWRTLATGGLIYAAIYTDAAESRFIDRFMRENLACHIRSIEKPICGVNDVLA